MGIYLSQPNKNKNSSKGESAKYQWVSSEMQGWRCNMEDAHIAEQIDADTAVFGVFDGHGGREVALYCEKHFVQELKNNQSFKNQMWQRALRETFLKMDEMLQTSEGKLELSLIQNDGQKKVGADSESFAGCTANVALIYKDTLICANAGDSRCILSSNGKAIEMSKDHKPDDEPEKKRVLAAGGFISDGRINSNLNLSRAIGDFEYKKDKSRSVDEQLIIAVPEFKEYKLTDTEDFMLLGCDGVWEMMNNQQNIDFVRKRLQENKDIQLIIEELLDALLAPDTNSGSGCDNMTAIIVKLRK